MTDLSQANLNLIETVEEANQFVSWIGQRRPENMISIDIETGEHPGRDTKDALSPWKGKIRTVQVGDGETGWCMDWSRWSGAFYQAVVPYNGPIVFHNVAFEAKWFAMQSDWDFPWHQAHDTMIMSQVISPNRATHGLKPLTAALVDTKAAALQELLEQEKSDNGWTWGTIPINHPRYWQYGALDTVITTRLALDHFWDLVKPGGMYNKTYELEMGTRRVATAMEVNGARINLDYTAEKYNELVSYTESLKAWGMERFDASITSNIQMVRLFESMGAEFTELTKSGGKSVADQQLQIFLRDGNPAVKELTQAILNQRKSDKLAGSYFLNFQHNQLDGVLHPDIKTMAARTGRMSIVNPALQTLPSGDAVVRRAFIPREEDQVIISSDLDQVEFRLTACFSEDEALIKLFHEADAGGGDVFTSIMRQVYRDETLQKADARRKLIKGVVYGKLYGAGVEKMALTAGVDEGQMGAVVHAFDDSYPGIKRFQKRVEWEGAQHLAQEGVAYVETLTGRRLPADSDRIYSLTNYKIQGTAAEVFKQNLLKIDAQGLTEFMVVPVHDEIVMSVPEKDVEEIKQTVKEAMTTREGWAIPLTADVEGGFKNWGDKYSDGH